MIGRLRSALTASVVVGALALPSAAEAQQKPRPPQTRPQPRSRSFEVTGYGMLGSFSFAARDSFEAILGGSTGPVFGGGARVGLPYRDLFIDVGVWRFSNHGERVLVVDNDVYPLGIPVDIAMTPIEISAGWRFRLRRLPKLRPYIGGGVTAMKYTETSEFATEAENVDQFFSGYHVFGGAEYKMGRWFGLAGEAAWTRVPDAIGESGASAAFNEDDLGGVSFRVKIVVGR